MNTNWYQEQRAANTSPPTNQGVFTTFVNGESDVQNYLVPAGGMAVLIDLNGGKMWFKSVNFNGVPAPRRSFTIKEIPAPVPEGSNVVTRKEFETLSTQVGTVSDSVNQLIQMLKQKNGGEST